jgi:hypothetical protein
MYDIDHPRPWTKSIMPGLVVFMGSYSVRFFAAGMYFEHVMLVNQVKTIHVR